VVSYQRKFITDNKENKDEKTLATTQKQYRGKVDEISIKNIYACWAGVDV
jgi:hypothetical protein